VNFSVAIYERSASMQVSNIPAAEAFRPLKDGGCPLVNGQ
jgi:hypothetical protein